MQYGTVDVARGQTKTVTVASNHYLAANTLVFNATSGNLMRLTSQVNPTDPSSATTWNLIGLCNLYSPNMDGYVTSEELESAVSDAISKLLNLEELNY